MISSDRLLGFEGVLRSGVQRVQDLLGEVFLRLDNIDIGEELVPEVWICEVAGDLILGGWSFRLRDGRRG